MTHGWMIFLVILTFTMGVNCGLTAALLCNFFSRET